jgi:hypothetical protein
MSNQPWSGFFNLFTIHESFEMIEIHPDQFALLIVFPYFPEIIQKVESTSFTV